MADVRPVAIAFTWFVALALSVLYLNIGKMSLGTDIAVGLLIIVAVVVTLAVTFGLEYYQTKMDKERPSTKTLAQMSTELTEMNLMINDLTKKVDSIQHELEE